MSSKPRFLSLEIGPENSSLSLDPEESAHCVRVLRLLPGDPVILIDGKGNSAEASILKADPKKTLVSIHKKQFKERHSNLQLVFGTTKPPALESIFRKCTELGIRAFQPLITEHSTRLGGWNEDRWRKILVEACKQSQEFWLPELKEPQKFQDWLASRPPATPLVFCDENFREHRPTDWAQGTFDILVGPEGGWSDEERELLTSQTVVPLSLGPNRLRAETACLVALTLVKSKIQEI